MLLISFLISLSFSKLTCRSWPVDFAGECCLFGMLARLRIVHQALHCHLLAHSFQPHLQPVDLLPVFVDDLPDLLALLHLASHHLLVLLFCWITYCLR